MQLRDLDVSHAVATSAGLFGVWRASAFDHVNELEQWESEVSDDSALERQIAAGAFVPINVGGNGVFQVTVRGVETPGILSERERSYLLTSSDPYLLVSDGVLELGGLEAVGNYIDADKVEIPLDSGRYAAVVHLVDWQAEPGGRGPDGNPSAGALPDFVVEIFVDIHGGLKYRTKVGTFDRPRSRNA
ncbi:hypothetical protein [Saccharomonospora cyanea]|uniref:Uncharacterized protein n=1 Tax=Saccharomonospora cyanea NA-134 TaxID=882082 RepID=H5XPS4_9PSEU|nr:hypothetical protein [Saccharomonospora cyanea]EHR61152.1 hypothetical protein SaccyDRAFT_2272 [Saccharomonospora cyanea NA-134]